MKPSMLNDLDELILSVREPESKKLIAEAVNAYRGNALRSAVVATWIAIAYDIITKIRELASQGEKMARSYVSDLDSAIASQKIPKLQKYENELLEKAQKDFELFSSHELNDLERINDDRNKCAHPAFVSEEFLFAPTPELVRTHITHAIVHLLRHPPVQGKSIFLRLENDILSEGFPSDPQMIEILMRDKFLHRTRDSIIVQMAKGLFTTLLGSERDKYRGKEASIAHAFAATAHIRSDIFDEHIPSFIKKKAEEANVEQCLEMLTFIGVEPRLWDWFSSTARIKMCQIISDVELDKLSSQGALSALRIDDIANELVPRIMSLAHPKKVTFIANNPNRHFVEEAINLYALSSSFRLAEWNGENLILPHAQYFDADLLKRTIDAAINNSYDQILHAADTSKILIKLFDLTKRLLPTSNTSWKELYDVLKNKDLLSSYTYSELIERMRRERII